MIFRVESICEFMFCNFLIDKECRGFKMEMISLKLYSYFRIELKCRFRYFCI